MNRRCLVTGSAGFLGQYILRYLLSQGHNVVGLDNYSLGTYKHEKIFNIDLVDRNYTEKFIKEFRPEIVYHLASWATEGASSFIPIKVNENNFTSHLNLLIPCIKYGMKRYVLCSSMSVFGNQNPPFDETLECKPEDLYAISKVAMENSTRVLSKVHGFEYVIARPHNIYGIYQNMADPLRNVVAIFINRMLNKQPFYIYGDGEQRRAFTYVDDTIEPLVKLGFGPFDKEIFNIGPIEEFTVNQLSEEIMKHFPENQHLKPIYLPDRPLEVKNAWSTNDKAIKLLNYKTNTSFKDGIKKMCDWAKTVGYQKPIYLDELELEGENIPLTWKEKLI